MAIHRTNHSKDYTVMANYHFRDHELSWKAKGILSLMLSLPDDWEFNYQGLAAMANDNVKSLRSGINELKKRGYLKIVKVPVSKGNNRISYEWEVYEKPMYNHFVHAQDVYAQNVDTQDVYAQSVDTQDVYAQKDTQLNTK